MKKDREKNKKYSNITDSTIMGSTSEESALHARANREHFSALDRLEEISKWKTNPNYIKQNINQQEGFSAEIKEQVRVNEHNILAGKPERVVQYTIFLAGKRLRLRIFSQTMPRPRRTTRSWIMSVWIKRGMSFLARLRKVNLWAEMVRSVLKNSYLKTIKNTWKTVRR